MSEDFDVKPLWIARWIVKRPWLFVLLLGGLMIGGTIAVSVYPMVLDYGISAFRVRDHWVAIREESMLAAVAGAGGTTTVSPTGSITSETEMAVLSTHHILTTNVPASEAPQVVQKFKLLVVYDAGVGGNLLTKAGIEKMRAIESNILAHPDYKKHCWKAMGGVDCTPPVSLLNYFYPQITSLGVKLLNGRGTLLTSEPINDVLLAVIASNNFFFLDTAFNKVHLSVSVTDPSQNNLVSRYVRTSFMFGVPVTGYKNRDDQKDAQSAVLKAHLLSFILYIDKIPESHYTNANTFSFSYGGAHSLPIFSNLSPGDFVSDALFLNTLMSDLLLALISLVIVLVFAFIKTRSLVVTLGGMFEIIMSLPCAYFMTRVVFGIRYVGILNGAGLFLIMGIGIDDVFVFWDQFNHFSYLSTEKEPLLLRLSQTYRTAAKSMLTTSFTTAAAFAANILSEIPAIKHFGIYMSLLVVYNYLFVITWFPAIIVCARKRLCCRKSHENDVVAFATVQPEHRPSLLEIGQRRINLKRFPSLFRYHLAPTIYKLRYILIVLILAASGVFVYQIIDGLQPSQSYPSVFPKSHIIQRFTDSATSFAGSSTSGIEYFKAATITVGCDGVVNSGAVEDVCGVCEGASDTCFGCDGVPLSGKTYDSCNVCGGSNDCLDCNDVPWGSSVMDICNVCAGDGLSCRDACGVIHGDNSTCIGPSAVPMNTSLVGEVVLDADLGNFNVDVFQRSLADALGVPVSQIRIIRASPGSVLVFFELMANSVIANGTELESSLLRANGSLGYTVTGAVGSVAVGCDGLTMPPLKVVDACGVCGGDNTTCAGCDGIPYSGVVRDCLGVCGGYAVYDACGVCNGTNLTCRGCDGIANSGARFDACNVCDGRNASMDACGVCFGTNSTCAGCDGVPYSGKKVDMCGVCDGSNACLPQPPPKTDFVSVYVVWGISSLDRTQSTTVEDPLASFQGVPIFDATFDLSDPQAQMWINDVALTLMNGTSVTTFTPTIVPCFIIAFKRWLVLNGFTFPVPPADFRMRLTAFLCADRTYTADVGFTATGVAWCRCSFLSKFLATVASYHALPFYNEWESYVKAMNGDPRAPTTANKAFQTCDTWIRIFSEITCISGTSFGIGISVASALLTMFLCSGSFRMSLFAALTILSNIALVMAFFVWMGWKLGAIEAISISILVGLSADYTLHIAEAYGHAHDAAVRKHPESEKSLIRMERVRIALTVIGPSILGSSLTTVGASAVLLACTILVFAQFGAFVMVTLGAALIYSLFFFVALLSSAGPVDKTGTFKRMARGFAFILPIVGLGYLGLWLLATYGDVHVIGPNGSPIL